MDDYATRRDSDALVFNVDIVPSETRHLTATHSGQAEQVPEAVETVARNACAGRVVRSACSWQRGVE
ncbi:MAG: hypothetical protein ACLP6E_14710 [Acidimicrobiales bacterium]